MKTETVGASLKSNDPAKGRAVRAGAGIGYNNIGTISSDKVFHSDKRMVVENNGEAGVNSKIGDVWWYVEGIIVKEDSTPRTGWVAERHGGVSYLFVTLDIPVPPPPPPPAGKPKIVSMVITYDDGTTEKLV